MFLPSFKLGHDIGGTSIVSQRVGFIFFMAGVKKTRENNVFQVNRQNSNFVEGEFVIKDQKILVLFKSASGAAMS